MHLYNFKGNIECNFDFLWKINLSIFFLEKRFENYIHKKIYSGNVKDNAYIVKERYHKDFFNVVSLVPFF